MNGLKKLKKDKKGFTLVELIVVLVILAILAAIMVPALLGWIDKAREKQYVIDARSIYVAAQAKASEKYATDSITPAASGSGMVADAKCEFTPTDITEIISLASISATVDTTKMFWAWKGAGGKDGYTLIGMAVELGGDTVCVLANGTWEIKKDGMPDMGDLGDYVN